MSNNKSTKPIKNKYFQNFEQDKKNSSIIRFDLKNIDIHLSLANSLRRCIIGEIPIYAIDINNVQFDYNNGIINNEMLSRRLALVPLNYEYMKKIYNTGGLNEFHFTMEAKNETDESKKYYTGGMKVNNDDNISDVMLDNIPLFQLNSFQELKFKAYVTFNNQREAGAFFNPTAVCIYTFKEDPGKFKEVLESNKGEFESDLDRQNFILENKERYFLKNEDGEPQIFSFLIETVGQIPAVQLLEMGCDALIKKLDILNSALVNNNSDIISIKKAETFNVLYDFIIPGEDHTLANLLTQYLLDNEQVAYAANQVTHPFRPVLIIRVGLKVNNNVSEVSSVFLNTLAQLQKLIMEIKDEWKNFISKQKVSKNINKRKTKSNKNNE